MALGVNPLKKLVTVLRACAEETRLRILALLSHGDLTVSELVQTLGQSQPSVSRHLKLLTDAGLLSRHREGTWIFYGLSGVPDVAQMTRQLIGRVANDDAVIARDRERLNAVRGERAANAENYFRENASDWDRIRSLYVPEAEVEARLKAALRGREIKNLLDIGTGTGRMLELFANDIGHGTGVDMSQDMLGVARALLASKGLSNCRVRKGNMYALAEADESQDAIIFHLVLHYAEDGAAAIREAARTLVSGGIMLVVDFAPHDLEFLRDEHAHRRLGFSDSEVVEWATSAQLRVLDMEHLRGGKLTVTFWSFEKSHAIPEFLAKKRRFGGRR